MGELILSNGVVESITRGAPDVRLAKPRMGLLDRMGLLRHLAESPPEGLDEVLDAFRQPRADACVFDELLAFVEGRSNADE